MATIYWVYLFGGLALLAFVLFVLFYLKDMDFKRSLRLPKNYLWPNWMLLLVFAAALGCSVLLYLDIQRQVAALLQ